MDSSFILGLIVSLFTPIFIFLYVHVLKLYKTHRNRQVDAKRRKTFKIVQDQ
jgi:hypothetical protein